MAEDDPNLKMRLDVAEMKGMLQATLSNHGNTLAAHDNQISNLQGKVSIAEGNIRSQDEKIKALEKHDISSAAKHDKDITELKSSQSGMLSKVMMVVTPIIAISSLLLILLKDIYGG